jgi:FAD/FMN-containing dehydrogenase
LFQATIGGLGLTGLILWAEFRLTPIRNPGIDLESIRYETLEDFFTLSKESERAFSYTVSWVDCLASGKRLGRGHFMRGNFSSAKSNPPSWKHNGNLSVPFNAPSYSINPITLRAFNFAYYWRQPARVKRRTVSFEPFFYPLDAILNWNRIYGRSGFLQYQCVVPFSDGSEAIREILHRISAAGMGSFLAVLKTFGSTPSLGMLSFPREGVTLALDFPNRGEPLFRLLEELDGVVRNVKGAVYPAKDARMSRESFEIFYPRYQEFGTWIDPQFSSSFLRRVFRSDE